MATTYADNIARGRVFWSAYLPRDLATRAERFILPNRRSEFVRRAIEREVSRLERQAAVDAIP